MSEVKKEIRWESIRSLGRGKREYKRKMTYRVPLQTREQKIHLGMYLVGRAWIIVSHPIFKQLQPPALKTTYSFSNLVIPASTVECREIKRACSSDDVFFPRGAGGIESTLPIHMENYVVDQPSHVIRDRAKSCATSIWKEMKGDGGEGKIDCSSQAVIIPLTSAAGAPMIPQVVKFLNVVPLGHLHGR